MRFHEQDALATQRTVPNQCFELHLADALTGLGAIGIKRTKACVVSRVFVLAAGIAKPHNQPFNGTGLLLFVSAFLRELIEDIEN